MTELAASLRLQLIDDVSGTARRIESAMTLAAQHSAGAVEQLRLKQLEATNAARLLSAELRRLQSSSSSTDEEIQQVSTALVRAREAAAGYAASARDLAAAERQAAAEATRLSTATRTASTVSAQGATTMVRGADDVARASKQQTRGLAEGVNMATEMALGFGGLSPKIRELSIGLAMGGNNAVVMANAMGPLGIVLGIATGVLPTLITQLSGAGDEQRRLAAETERANQTLLEQADAIRQRNAAMNREAAAERGELDVDEQRAVLEAQSGRLNARRVEQERELRRVTLDPTTRRERSDAEAIRQAIGVAIDRGVTGSTDREAGVSIAEQVVAQLEAEGLSFGTGTQRASAVGSVAEGARRTASLRTIIGIEADREQRFTQALSVAEQREARETALRTASQSRERASGARDEMGALLTVGGRFSDTERAQLLSLAGDGRLGTDRARGLLGRLSEQDRARFTDAAERARGFELQAARERLGVTEDVEGYYPTEGAEPPAVERVRQARRRQAAPLAPVPAPAGPAGPLIPEAAVRSLEGLARGIRIDVRVRDERDAVDVTVASDMTGGQG